ncbi:MAG: hypothetical protein M1480_11315 [Bacteroidetes bacterium]|nr:hypothetical protein [Bacteroidota bacterium]
MEVTIFAPQYNREVVIENILNENFLSQKPLSPFDSLSIEFLSSLSKKILESKEIKNFPELVALAYWLRKSNIVSIINNFRTEINYQEIIVPRGFAFHIAPSNVDSIFLYSWALSFLVGNINIVRVTQDINVQLDLLLSFIREIFKDEKWNPVSTRNIVLTYPRDEKINRFISLHSDVRVLWGGDETINSIRVLSSKPTTKDITFADKFSYSMIKASSYNNLSDDKKAIQATQFYNDAYWFDQMACSSPRFVLFIGEQKECEEASDAFWKSLEKELKRRGKNDSIDVAMEKLVYMYESVSKAEKASAKFSPEKDKPTVLKVDKEEINKFRESCGGGFFFECFLESLDELVNLVSRKDQTLAYYGFEKEELNNFIKKVNGAGADRIVPIGQALNFSPIWDGYSLLNELSKRVNII